MRSHREATTLDQLAADVALALPPPWAWSHLTAARLFRLPLPSEWTRAEPLHVLRPTECAQVRRPGLVGHRGLERRETLTLRGHPTTTAAWTWADLASLPPLSVVDLVIAGDAFATRDPALLERLVAIGRRGGSRRGARKLRAAAELLRSGSGSPMETRARLAFLEAGLPEPELNATVHGTDGHFLARVDFLWREARVVVEYEGDQHRTDRRQWQNDIARVRLLEEDGLRVVRVTSLDLFDASRLRTLVAMLRGLVT
ncbi:hypothetical protein GCM10009845_03540 [Pedococcus bigeumensis]